MSAGLAQGNCADQNQNEPNPWWPRDSRGGDPGGKRMRRYQAQAEYLCRGCPVKRACARTALVDSRGLSGIWAGIYIPNATTEKGRPRAAAIKLLELVATSQSATG